MLYGLAIFIFVIICILLMGIILLQSSKTGGMGTAMGGAAINTAFGGQGADKLLVRITTVLAVSFMSLALIIGMMDNPASRIEANSESILGSKNEGASSINAGSLDASKIQDEELTPVNINNTLNIKQESDAKKETE